MSYSPGGPLEPKLETETSYPAEEELDYILKSLWSRNNAFNFECNKFVYDTRDNNIDMHVINILTKLKKRIFS